MQFLENTKQSKSVFNLLNGIVSVFFIEWKNRNVNKMCFHSVLCKKCKFYDNWAEGEVGHNNDSNIRNLGRL